MVAEKQNAAEKHADAKDAENAEKRVENAEEEHVEKDKFLSLFPNNLMTYL